MRSSSRAKSLHKSKLLEYPLRYTTREESMRPIKSRTLFALLILLLLGCKESPPSSSGTPSKTSRQALPDLDLCRCLSEPGNGPFMKKNEAACDVAISARLEVPNWQKVNFSQNPRVEAEWKKLEGECGSTVGSCIEKEKKTRGCTASSIKDPNWNRQKCTEILVEALKVCGS